MKLTTVLALAAFSFCGTGLATTDAFAKAKPHKAAHHHKAKKDKKKDCKGTFKYWKGGKCEDSRKKK
ncbi:hypothetical protein [Hyphomicrobium sp.]|uniref:hypothetical protein n=1 Tax=Hyphomicrobium sp. TaxID=82 RepID=UPI000F90AA20|nr:hypothetical protein [Hyphomicrobium sp.]RUP09902.1 MAG: hypothetical protein EKK38_05500 [Hyphomicrobium sp.]